MSYMYSRAGSLSSDQREGHELKKVYCEEEADTPRRPMGCGPGSA